MKRVDPSAVQPRIDPSCLLAAAALALWLLSLFLPVMEARQTQGPTSGSGGEILAMGWLGLLAFQFGWLANFCLVPAMWSLWRRRPASPRACLFAAVAIALLTIDALTWTDFPNDGGPGPITAYLSGYWTWIAANAVGVAALLIRATRPAG